MQKVNRKKVMDWCKDTVGNVMGVLTAKDAI